MDMSSGLSLDTVRAHTDMADLQASTGCSGSSCDALLMEFATRPLWFCNGESAVAEGGNFKGHVFPGVLFLIWTTHWMFGAMRRFFQAKKADRPWESRSTEQVLWFDGKPIESIIKVVMPLIAMVLELWLAHPGGYRLLVCGEGDARAGHFVGNHLNNWAHALMYPGFIISGVVELTGTRVSLPLGTNQVFLGIGFVVEALLMGLHKKHSPLDVIVHLLLTSSMLSSGLFCFLEGAWPRNFLFSCGRIASVYLQGFWFIGSGHILYSGLLVWDPTGGDLAPAMYTPILFLTHVVSVCTILMGAFIFGNLYFGRLSRSTPNHGGSSRINGSSHLPTIPEVDGSLDLDDSPRRGLLNDQLPVSTIVH